MTRRAPSIGFAPLASPDARWLILGTLPGPRSLAAHEYYAHPRNAFWPIMSELFGPFDPTYADRVRGLARAGIAVWDVLASAPREGALDSRIERRSALANDFPAFYRAHPGITTLCFNGAEAGRLYQRFVFRGLDAEHRGHAMHVLPSTSPARAIPYEQKLREWSRVLGIPQRRS